MRSGERVAGAFKRLPYHTQRERATANAELAGLKDVRGCPHFVQCYGVFDCHCVATGKGYIYIAMQ